MKIKKLGNTIMFRPEITIEDYDLVSRVAPETFTLKDDKGNAIFKFMLSNETKVTHNSMVLEDISPVEPFYLQGNITYYGSENSKDLALAFAPAIRHMAVIEAKVAERAAMIRDSIDEMAENNIEILG